MTEPKHKNLYAALAAAQGEMGKALKDTNNPHFKSKYADLASVMDACMPALSRHGIAVLQPAFDDETGRYVKTIFVHGESGESFECRVPLIVAKNDMQGYGSAVTYARRYGLMGMAGIAPEDDDGNAAAAKPPTPEDDRKTQARFDAGAAERRIISSIVKKANDADLTELWRIEAATIDQIGGEGKDRIIAAFKARKAALQKPADDLDGDHIPDFGGAK